MADKKILDFENLLKNILTPYIWLLIQDVNNYLIKNNFPFILLVSGGDALAKFFPNDPKLESHDFDLRLNPIIGSENLPNLRNIQHKLATLIAKYFELNLNSYINRIRPRLEQKIKSTFPKSVDYIKSQNRSIFKGNRGVFTDNKCVQTPIDDSFIDEKCDLYTVTYTFKLNNYITTDSMIDIFCARPDNIYHYSSNINEYNINTPKTFQPYVFIENVPYVSLGYLIWDTLRLIEWSREKGYHKLPRYQMKLEQIIRGLYHPDGRLSCTAMKEFIKGCMQARKEVCVINGESLDKDAIVDYAVFQGFIPIQLSKKFKEELSKEYLCDYVKNFKKNIKKQTMILT